MGIDVQGSDRNQRCSICGKKIKVCGGDHAKRSYAIPIVFGLLGLICIVTTVIIATRERRDTPGAPQSDTSLAYQRIGREYVNRHPDDHWWWHVGMIDAPDIPVVKAELEFLSARVNSLIAKYRGTNDATERIATTFPLVLPSLYTYGTSQQFFTEADYDPTLLERAIELCCIPAAEATSPTLEATLAWYRSDWRAVMLRAVDIPDPVLIALVYHELGHAFTHGEGNASALAAPDTDAFVYEEVEAHDRVETPILNAVTKRQFSALIGTILARNEAVTTPGDIIALVTPEDMAALDAMLGMNIAGQKVAATVYAHWAFALLAAHADRTAKDPLREKIRLYRWLQQQRL